MKMQNKMMLLKAIALWFCAILVLTGCAGKAEAYQDKYDLGVKYVSEGNYEEAILALNAAIEIDPKQADAYLTLADIYIQQNNTDAAIAVIEQGLAALGSDESLSNKLEELTTSIHQEQSDETGSASTNKNSQIETDITSTAKALENKSYTMEDIYERINLRNLLSAHISVTKVFESDKYEWQFFQSDGHLSMTGLFYDADGHTSVNYFCSSDYEPFGFALNDDGFDRFLNVYLASDMEDWIVEEWSFLCGEDYVKNEEIVDTQVEDEVVKIVTSGLDVWDHSFTRNYYVDINSNRIIRCELSDTVKYDILYDLPVFETSDFVNEFINADDGNEITIVSKISEFPGECSIRVSPDVDWSVGWWTHSPIAVYTDEALLNKTYVTSNPGIYYVGKDSEYN